MLDKSFKSQAKSSDQPDCLQAGWVDSSGSKMDRSWSVAFFPSSSWEYWNLMDHDAVNINQYQSTWFLGVELWFKCSTIHIWRGINQFQIICSTTALSNVDFSQLGIVPAPAKVLVKTHQTSVSKLTREQHWVSQARPVVHATYTVKASRKISEISAMERKIYTNTNYGFWLPKNKQDTKQYGLALAGKAFYFLPM